jgi:hypothetical protein
VADFRDARLPERFWSKVAVDPSGCWLWTGYLTTKHPNGYGRFKIGEKGTLAHRLTWETLAGPIPAGMEIDHLCRVRRCCNPAHLEPVTHQENVLRGRLTTWARGAGICRTGRHDLTEANRLINKATGGSQCLACFRETQDRRNATRREPS